MAGGVLARWFGTAQLDHRAVLRMLGPVIVSTAFGTAFFALNPLLIAPVGIEAVSAVSSVEYLNFFLLSVFVSVATAGSVLVAQHRGRGDDAGVREAVGGTLWAAVLPAILLTVVLLAVRGPLLDALLGAAGPSVVHFGQIYLVGSALSYPALALTEACSASLRGIARTAPALYLTVASNGGFVLLAAILVRGAGLGVTGLAVALVTSRYLAAVLAVWLLRRDRVLGHASFWRTDVATVRRVTVIGLPFVAEQLFFNGGKLLIQVFIVGMGTLQITANAIGQSLIAIAEIVPQAMCIAIVPIVGQAIGAGRPDDARRIIRSFVWSATAVGVACALAMLAFLDPLLRLFDTPAEITDDVTAIFLIALAGRLLGVWSWSYLLPSGLRAAGDTIFTTTVATATMLVRVALIWLVGVHLGHGAVGVWAVMVFEWGLRSAAFLLRFRGTRWTRRAFVPLAPVPADQGPIRAS